MTYKSFSTCITQNYLVHLINMHHLNRTWLPSALLLHGSVTDQTGEKNSPSTWEEMAKDGGPEDRIRFIEQNCIVNKLLFSACSQYYTKLIDENCLNQRKLFGIVSKLLAPLYPSCSSAMDLANNFIGFFATKSPLFFMNLIPILSRVFIYLRKLQLQQQNSIVSPVLHFRLRVW